MARSVLRKGRMLAEDEEKIQRCTAFIESEVEAKDLTSSLYSAKILDFNDRSEIDSGETRVGRTRRLLEMLIMRGPYAYHEFLKALKKEGYEHVVETMEDVTESRRTPGRVRVEKLAGGSTDEDRLKKIEELLEQLCQRVTKLESRQDTPDIPDDELSEVKHQVFSLKNHTMSQIKDLIEENIKKDSRIADLSAQLEEKQRQLLEAEERILELEDRIQELEGNCKKYRQDIDQLKKQDRIQADRLQRQERKIQTQADRLQTQERKMSEQEKRLIRQQEQIQDNEDRVGEMGLKMMQMATVLDSVQTNLVNDGRIRVIGRNVAHTRNRGKTKWKQF